MTVEELVDILLECNPEAEVLLEKELGEDFPLVGVTVWDDQEEVLLCRIPRLS